MTKGVSRRKCDQQGGGEQAGGAHQPKVLLGDLGAGVAKITAHGLQVVAQKLKHAPHTPPPFLIFPEGS